MSKKLPLYNPLSVLLDKECADFTRRDMLRILELREIERITFHYTGIDAQLKELSLPFADMDQAEQILAAGERVDGSSLFKGLIDASLSDLYVVPSYKTAFLNPFDPKSLDFVCRYIDKDENLIPFAPDNILLKAHEHFKKNTGMEFHAMGELEFFLIREGGPEYFTPKKQTGYHSSSPFFKSGHVVREMVRLIVQITGAVKYAHAEVGFIDSLHSDLPLLSERRAEQHEIEFLTRPVDEMGDFIALSKWIIRNVAHRHGMLATFAPKLEEGVAGNGLHFHMELIRDGVNVMTDKDGALSESAYKLIGGLISYASTLSAFGNTVASAFLRLVPNQEAPTRICWSHGNRSAMIRVPLGWSRSSNLAGRINPAEKTEYEDTRGRQTVEIRSPDGSALFHLLLAGLTTAAEYGLTTEGMLELASRTEVQGNIFSNSELVSRLEALPASCVACSRLLNERRAMYEEFGGFPKSVIDYVAGLLARQNDEHLNSELAHMSAEERLTTTRHLMHQVIHVH